MPMIRDINLFLTRVIDSSYPTGMKGFQTAGGLFQAIPVTPMNHVLFRQSDPASKELLDALNMLVTKGEATVEEVKEFIYEGVPEDGIIASLTNIQESLPYPAKVIPHRLMLFVEVQEAEQVPQFLEVLRNPEIPRSMVCSPAGWQRVTRPRIDPIDDGTINELHRLLDNCTDVGSFLKQIGG